MSLTGILAIRVAPGRSQPSSDVGNVSDVNAGSVRGKKQLRSTAQIGLPHRARVGRAIQNLRSRVGGVEAHRYAYAKNECVAGRSGCSGCADDGLQQLESDTNDTNSRFING